MHNDEAEWATLEAQADFTLEAILDDDGEDTGEKQYAWRSYAPPDTGVPFKNTPHPDSYGAKLPMRSLKDPYGHPRIPPLTAAEKKAGTPKSHQAPAGIIKKASPHPESYRSDLPLRGLGLGTLGMGGSSWGCKKSVAPWPLSAAEKKALASRPLVYRKTQEAPNA